MTAGSINAFLDWFEGWSENIEEGPNPKQWERLRAKISAIPRQQGAAPSPEDPGQGVVPGTVLANGKIALNETEWRQKLQAELEAMGAGGDASLMARQEVFDPRVEPERLAHVIFDVEG